MKLRRVTGPIEQPVDLSDVKDYLRITHNEDDGLLSRLIDAATAYIESLIGRALLTQKWEIILNEFPSVGILFPKPPFQAIESVKYIDINGDEQTLDSSIYDLSPVEPTILSLKTGKSFPQTFNQPDAVKVVFSCGWESLGDVPYDLQQAILFVVAHWYANHQPFLTDGNSGIAEIPMTSTALLDEWRVRQCGQVI